MHVRPPRLGVGLLEIRPVTVSIEPPLEHELRFVLLGGDQPDYVLVQPGRHRIGFDVGHEAPLVFAIDERLNCFTLGSHQSSLSRMFVSYLTVQLYGICTLKSRLVWSVLKLFILLITSAAGHGQERA